MRNGKKEWYQNAEDREREEERLTAAEVFSCARDVSIGGTHCVLIVGFAVFSIPAATLDPIHDIAIPPRSQT